jgi:hypothetical protein
VQKIKGMSKLEVTMYAVDKASKGIDSIMKKGFSFTGKVF